MFASVDAVGVDMEPKREQAAHFFTLLHILIIILFGLLFVNMFIGVIVESFNREKDQLSLNHLLSKQ